MPEWTTALPDWKQRIINRESLIPCAPLFPDEASHALEQFKALQLVDAPGSPKMGEACRQWVFDFVEAIFGAFDRDSARQRINEFFLLVSKKNGKALALDTPIPTPSGWKTMGEIEEGDLVFGVDGKAYRVIATSGVFTDHKCFRVEFSNGESVVADAGHLWLTDALADNPGAGKGKNYGQRCRVRTTQEIADTLFRLYDGARNHSMEMPYPLECVEVDLPIAPYTLGAWLGDGHSASARITCHRDDVIIRESIAADGWPIRTVYNNGSAADVYAISDGDRRQKARDIGLASRLRQIGVLSNKHIPDCYFRASYSQRLALLQGLMDTDGTISKSGRVLSYSGKSETLVSGVSELLSTFGIKNSFIKRNVNCNGKPAGVAYFVQFMAFRDTLPVFRLKRKLDRMLLSGQTANSARSRTVQIVNAYEVPSVPVKCIAVNSLDRQFLFGRSLLPTHNSSIAAGIMLTALIRNWRMSNEYLIIAPTIEIANNSFFPARDMVRANDELSEKFHVQDHYRTITHRKSKATLKVVAADSETVGGKKAGFVLVDEVWMFGKRSNAENMLREATGGRASRPEGFTIFLSTQSDEPPAGVFAQALSDYRDIRDGKLVAPRRMGVLYEYPPEMVEAEEFRDPKHWYITNPNLGISVDEEFLHDEYQKATRAGSASLAGFFSKHLNVEIGMGLRSNRWAGAEYWSRRADPSLTLDSVIARSESIVIGIDGGGLDDLFGMCVLGRDRETKDWLAWIHAWCHSGVLERRKSIAARLRGFERAGELTIVNDELGDLDQIVEVIRKVQDAGLLMEVGVDPAGLGELVDALAEIDVTAENKRLIGVGQGYRMMNAIKTSERRLANGTLWHNGSALAAWAASNVKIEPTATAIRPTKQNAGDAKIDPWCALMNACDRMSFNPGIPEYQMFFLGASQQPTAMI